MNANVEERLAQRRKAREERRQREQEEQQQKEKEDEQGVFFDAFGDGMNNSSSAGMFLATADNSNGGMDNSSSMRRQQSARNFGGGGGGMDNSLMRKQQSARHFGGAGGMDNSSMRRQQSARHFGGGGGGMDNSSSMLRQQSGRHFGGGLDDAAPSLPSRPSMHREGSVALLKPPNKDTKSYNAPLHSLAPPGKDTKSYNAPLPSLAPPTKDTRSYKAEENDNDGNNNNPDSKHKRTSRESKRGSLQKKRSSSLSDMQQLQKQDMQKQNTGGTPKTPKGLRARPSISKEHSSTRNFSGKKLLDTNNDDAPFDPYSRGREPRRGNLQRYRSSSLTDLQKHNTPKTPKAFKSKDPLSLRSFSMPDDAEEQEEDIPLFDNHNNNPDSKHSRKSRDVKQGNLQRKRSSSLSDMQKLRQQDSGTPKTPKGGRKRTSVGKDPLAARNFPGKKFAESLDDDDHGDGDGQTRAGGREPKRGSVQRHRSSSLTDLHKFTPKTPKEMRQRLSVSSNNSKGKEEQSSPKRNSASSNNSKDKEEQSSPKRKSANSQKVAEDAPPNQPGRSGRSPKRASLQNNSKGKEEQSSPKRNSANGQKVAEDAPPNQPGRSGRSPKRGSLQRTRSSSLTDLSKHTPKNKKETIRKQSSAVSSSLQRSRGSVVLASDTENDDTDDDDDDGAYNRVGREPKRGLRRMRSSSLTDLKANTPKSLKELRKARNPAGRVSVKSLQITPTVIHPTGIKELGEKSPSRPRRGSRKPKLQPEESSSKSNLELEPASSHGKGDPTATDADDLPRFDPFASPGDQRRTRSSSRRSSVTGRTVKSAEDVRGTPSQRRTLRPLGTGKGSSRQISDGDVAPSTPGRPRKAVSHGTSPGRRPRSSKGASMPPELSDGPQADATVKTPKSNRKRPVMLRAKTIDTADLFKNVDDDDDDDEILFTAYRTPGTKKKMSVGKSSDHNQGYGFDLPWDVEESKQVPPTVVAASSQLTSQSMHAPAPPIPSKKAPTAPTKSDGAPPASGWSMANPDQVNKWKSKLSTTKGAAITTAAGTSSATSLADRQSRRRKSLGDPLTNSNADLGFEAPGKECDDGVINDVPSSNDINGDAPPPLMNLTREEHVRDKKRNSSTKSSARSARAQSTQHLGTTAARDSLGKESTHSNVSFQDLEIVSDNASTKEARQRKNTNLLDGSSRTLSSMESAKSDRNKEKSIQPTTTSNDSARSSRSRSNSMHSKLDEESGQSLHRRKSKEKSQNSKETQESHTGGRKSTRGNLSRHRSRSLSDLQQDASGDGDGQSKAGAKVRSKRRQSSHAQQLQSSDSSNIESKEKAPPTNSNATDGKMNTSDPNVSPGAGNKDATKPADATDTKSTTIKKRESGRRSTGGTSMRKSNASGEIKAESETRSEQQHNGGSKSPIRASRLEKRRVTRQRSSSLSDLPPRRGSKKKFSTDGKDNTDQTTMDDNIMDESTQDLSDEMHDTSARISMRGLRGPRKNGMQRAKTEDPTTAKHHSKPQGEARPGVRRGGHRRTSTVVVGKGRPTLLRHKSNSLSDMRLLAQSFRKPKPKKPATTATIPPALNTTEVEGDIERLKSQIEKFEADLKDATSTARGPEATKKHLEEEVKKEQANQLGLKGDMFDLYQDNVKLEENLEKTQQYYVELEDIRNAEIMKNEALQKNVPVFEKVIEAHETKLSRRTRYIEFERQTMQFYEDSIRRIVRNFQSKCDDPELVQALEQMARSDNPLPDAG